MKEMTIRKKREKGQTFVEIKVDESIKMLVEEREFKNSLPDIAFLVSELEVAG